MNNHIFEKMRLAFGICLALVACCPAWAQDAPAQAGDEPPTITVDVTARRWEEPLQDVPGSVSLVSGETIKAAGIQSVRDASHLIPNLTLPDFSVRWLSFPYVRGVGSGRNSPAVTTIIDGVPQLSYITANQEMLGVERVEFLRGPQGALYGRNALGGVINVIPSLPTDIPSRHITASLGNHSYFDTRGPMGSGGALGSFSFGFSNRNGYTTNDYTGHKLENNDAVFGHTQILWPRKGSWDTRLSLTAERDHDGDYGLGDLAALNANPYHVSHDFQGFSNRELAQPVFTAIKHGANAELTSITALQWFETHDYTDADFSNADLYRRGTNEQQHAYTQEFRLSPNSNTQINERTSMRWMVGTFMFSQNDELDSFTRLSPGVLQINPPVAATRHNTASTHSTGISAYGQANFTFNSSLDFTLGLRHDYEHRTADLGQFMDIMPGSATSTAQARSFSQTSPQVSMAYHLSPERLWYATAMKGYKTGGFNAQAPTGKMSYGEEKSWAYETGLKMAGLGNRLVVNLSLFRTSWDGMQLDVPFVTDAGGAYYIDNAGHANNQGSEIELTYRPRTGLELFGGMGLLHTNFEPGAETTLPVIGANTLPFAPKVTWHAGAQMSRKLGNGARGFARIDVSHNGGYFYDVSNLALERPYTLTSLRLGVDSGDLRVEAWATNLFDKAYTPVAFPYYYSPSGYIGQSGAPRTLGISMSRAF